MYFKDHWGGFSIFGRTLLLATVSFVYNSEVFKDGVPFAAVTHPSPWFIGFIGETISNVEFLKNCEGEMFRELITPFRYRIGVIQICNYATTATKKLFHEFSKFFKR